MAVLEVHADDPDGTGATVDRLHVLLEQTELDVLAALSTGLCERLRSSEASDDDLLQRLAPRVSHADDDVDRELRAMLSADLHAERARRLDGLVELLRSGTLELGTARVRIILDRTAAERVIQALNDLRIGLAATVGLERTPREDLAPADPRHETLRLVDALAWLQAGLIDFVDVSHA